MAHMTMLENLENLSIPDYNNTFDEYGGARRKYYRQASMPRFLKILRQKLWALCFNVGVFEGGWP